MKVLLLKDVYKLGRAGEVKIVADGYGRNYLLPQGLAVLATEGALRQSEKIREAAKEERQRLNEELSVVAEKLEDLTLSFAMKAGETDKLYGSVTTMMIADSIKEQAGVEVDKRDVDSEPIKSLGVHSAAVRLTIDLVPEITILVHREGEAPETAYEIAAEETAEDVTESFAELKEELDTEAVEPEDLAEEGEADELEPDELEEGA